MPDLDPIADLSAGDWLVARLRALGGRVTDVLPGGFAAYARVLHPVETHDGRPDRTWAQVCQVTGRIPHALMQWTAISAPAPLGAVTDGEAAVGSLAPPSLSALLDVLAPVTGDQLCFHALWEGWGWVDGGGVAAWSVDQDGHVSAGPALTPGVSTEVWALPRLRLPGRDHLLFRGPLRAALEMGWHRAPGGFQPQSPSLLWPADQSWCVATEIDFDSTLVGGDQRLIDAVLAAPGLEAWPVGPDGDLTATGDRRNA